MLFIPVPEGRPPRTGSTSTCPERGTRDEMVEVAVAAGATIVGDHRGADGTGWVTLTDPEGNEFCIERRSPSAAPPAPELPYRHLTDRRLLRHTLMVVTVVFVGVVVVRLLLPLLIPRFPLPAILACLVVDAVDQTIFQAFGYDPPGYQGYDKAMDVFYLAIAYLATCATGPSLAPSRSAASCTSTGWSGWWPSNSRRPGRCCWSSPTRSSTSSSPTRACAPVEPAAVRAALGGSGPPR